MLAKRKMSVTELADKSASRCQYFRVEKRQVKAIRLSTLEQSARLWSVSLVIF